MSKDHWNENSIEELLRNSPDVYDTRSKDEVFNRLKAEGTFEENPTKYEQQNPTPNKTKRYNIQLISSIVAMFAIVIILPLLFIALNNSRDEESSTGVPESEAKSALEDMSEQSLEKDQQVSSIEEESGTTVSSFSTSRMKWDVRTALYADEVTDETVFTIGLAGSAAESVPVSLKIPQWFIEESFGDNQPTYLQLYEKIAPLLDEPSLGFNEYHPLVGKFEEKGSTLIHYLPKGHGYDRASATLSNYMGVLNDTFGEHYDKVILLNEDGSQLEMSEIGLIDEPVNLTGLQMKTAFYVFHSNDGQRFLSSNFRAKYEAVEYALTDMAHNTNDIYKTAILNNATAYHLKIENQVVSITFDSPLDVEAYPFEDAMAMIESMILTAGSFGYQVSFHNIIQPEWNGFIFTNTIPQVLGINELDFEKIIEE